MPSSAKFVIGAVLSKCDSLYDLLNHTKSREDFIPDCIDRMYHNYFVEPAVAPDSGSLEPGDIAAAVTSIQLSTTAIIMISVSVLLLVILAMVASPTLRRPLTVLFESFMSLLGSYEESTFCKGCIAILQFFRSWRLERADSQDTTEITRLELPSAPPSAPPTPCDAPEVKADAPVDIKVERISPRSVSVDPLANNTWSDEYLFKASASFAKWNQEQAYLNGCEDTILELRTRRISAEVEKRGRNASEGESRSSGDLSARDSPRRSEPSVGNNASSFLSASEVDIAFEDDQSTVFNNTGIYSNPEQTAENEIIFNPVHRSSSLH